MGPPAPPLTPLFHHLTVAQSHREFLVHQTGPIPVTLNRTSSLLPMSHSQHPHRSQRYPLLPSCLTKPCWI